MDLVFLILNITATIITTTTQAITIDDIIIVFLFNFIFCPNSILPFIGKRIVCYITQDVACKDIRMISGNTEEMLLSFYRKYSNVSASSIMLGKLILGGDFRPFALGLQNHLTNLAHRAMSAPVVRYIVNRFFHDIEGVSHRRGKSYPS
jgi:hypothetical protein